MLRGFFGMVKVYKGLDLGEKRVGRWFGTFAKGLEQVQELGFFVLLLFRVDIVCLKFSFSLIDS